MAAPPAISQNADALAIPVRKNGEETSAEKSTAASAEKIAARRLTSKLRVNNPTDQNASPPAEQKPSAPPTTPSPAKASPVIESRLSLYNLESAEVPTGLLRKRTSPPASSNSDSANNQQPGPQKSVSELPKTTDDQRRDAAATVMASAQNRSDEQQESRRSNEPRRTASRNPDNENSERKSRESERESSRDRNQQDDSRRETSRRSVVESDSSANSESSDVQQKANQAALDNLRPSSSSSENTVMANAPAMPPQARFASPEPSPSARLEPAAATAEIQQPPANQESQLPDSQLQTALAAPPAPPSPNLYLPQATPAPRRGSIWSRLFGRDNQQTARVQSTVLDFNSDYATRDGDDVCPVVLPGLGINGRDIPYGQEDAYRLTSSLPAHFRPTDLVRLPTQYCHYGNALYLRREAAASLCRMIGDAARQGLTIRVVSAFRDYDHQLRLYTQAVARGGENQKSVARPGRSEHYLGTTVDLTNNEEHALERSFGNTAEGRWLAANAGSYGWKLTVMSDNARRSHNDEPWHLRYLGSAINNPPSTISPIAQQRSQSQPPGVFGKIGRFLGLRR